MNIPRIDCVNDDPQWAVDTLRRRLAWRGAYFDAGPPAWPGHDPAPEQLVETVCADIRRRGLEAVLEHTRKLHGVAPDVDEVRTPTAALRDAVRRADPEFVRTVRRVRDRLLLFHSGILHRDAVMRNGRGCVVSLRYRPVRRVGVGLAVRSCSVSELLGSVVPAQAAGVGQIALFLPPDLPEATTADLLAAAQTLGLGEVYRVGGVPAVAAQTYGVEGIEAVDKIVGASDALVAIACRYVHGVVDASACGAPCELLLLADWTADPRLVAVDLLGQSAGEHAAAVLITWEPALVDSVATELGRELRLSGGVAPSHDVERSVTLVLARDEEQAVALVNLVAPARLLVSTADPSRLAERLTAAGMIFLGHDAPTAVADQVAGPSRLLPAGGSALWSAGLTANDFLRRATVVDVDRAGLQSLAADLRRLADHEGRPSLRRCVDIRLDDAPLPTSEIDL